jgi:hypothetical protein
LLHPLVQTISRYFEDEYPQFDKKGFKLAIFNGIQEDSSDIGDKDGGEIILSKTEHSVPIEAISVKTNNIMAHLKDCKEATKNLSKIITKKYE